MRAPTPAVSVTGGMSGFKWSCSHLWHFLIYFRGCRHSSLSFRNLERTERGSWHGNTRGLQVRNRRNAPKDPQVLEHHHQHQQQQQALVLQKVNSSDTSVGFVATRNRRDVPACVPNYNAQRQLWVGCTAENLIDVSPLCSVEGEEGKSIIYKILFLLYLCFI